MSGDRDGTHSRRNFILQQGLPDPPPGACDLRYSSLMFQPRLVGAIVLAGVLLQEPAIFLGLSALLWIGALYPRRNPFDLLHNRTIGAGSGNVPLAPAPAPRRFAQGMAASFTLVAGLLLLAGHRMAALTFEVLILLALSALIFGRFCLGSYLYLLFAGKAEFANRTLPWGRGA